MPIGPSISENAQLFCRSDLLSKIQSSIKKTWVPHVCVGILQIKVFPSRSLRPCSAYLIFSLFSFFFQLEQYFSLTIIQLEQCFSLTIIQPEQCFQPLSAKFQTSEQSLCRLVQSPYVRICNHS